MSEFASLSSLLEEHIGPISSLQLLQNLGYSYLRPQDAHIARTGKASNVLLETILEQQLRRLNRLWYKGREHEFSDSNLRLAIQGLKEASMADTPAEAGQRLHALLLQGRTLPQSIGGDVKSFPLHYIDWAQPERNVFHVIEDFEVQSATGAAEASPTIVLFINGIPLAVIEYGRTLPDAISRHRRNQRPERIPQLFAFSQLLLAFNRDEARYAAPGARQEQWMRWREDGIDDELARLVNRPLSRPQKELFYAGRNYLRQYFDEREPAPRVVSPRDRALYSLCRPERLLEFIRMFSVFIEGERYLARHQQYFAVKEALERSRAFDAQGRRAGGTIAQANGSGKYLCLLLLVRAILLEHPEGRARLLVVSDRTDLDGRLRMLLDAGGNNLVRATTGRHLLELLADSRHSVLTIAFEKFESAMRTTSVRENSEDFFVMLDSGARGISEELHGRLRKVMPNACCIEFTGAPLKRDDRAFAAAHGGFLDQYSIAEARRDGVIVPIFYETRLLSKTPDARALEEWFAIECAAASPANAAELKKRFAGGKKLPLDEQRIRLLACGIGNHFRRNIVAPHKALLAAGTSIEAIRYKKYLDEFGRVRSDVFIPGPAALEQERKTVRGAEEVFRAFWNPRLERHGNEREYHRALANDFKNPDGPEILIVAGDLPADFEGPQIQTIFLDREMEAQDLLLWASLGNAPRIDKDFGLVIDFAGALEMPSEFDPAELSAALIDPGTAASALQNRHAELLELFPAGEAKRHPEKNGRELDSPERRALFSQRFFAFHRAMHIALSGRGFLAHSPKELLHRYKQDLALFQRLRIQINRRYAEAADFPDHEEALQLLLREHSGEHELRIPVGADIFDNVRFEAEIEEVESAGEKADMMVHRIAASIRDRLEDDPFFYRRISKRVEELIRDWRAGSLGDRDYLAQARDLLQAVRDHARETARAGLPIDQIATEFALVVNDVLAKRARPSQDLDALVAKAGLDLDRIVRERCIVDWINNTDQQNEIRNAIDAYLYSLESPAGIQLSFDEMDAIIERVLTIAKARYGR
jgi:type I restriction enzyme R subunit